jgi:hypothetical protein
LINKTWPWENDLEGVSIMGRAAEEAKRIIEAQRVLQDARQWELHVSEMIKRGAHPFFEKVCEALKHEVEEFNQVHGTVDPIYCRQLSPPNQIEVSRQEMFPRALAELIFYPYELHVKLRVCTQKDPSEERLTHTRTFRFNVSTDSRLLLDSNDISGISQQAMQPMYDAYFATGNVRCRPLS